MANLPQSDAWDAGIYQIETSDPVLGGVNGPANLGAKGLANRTVWLRNILAGMTAGVNLTIVERTTSGNWTCPAGVTEVLVLDAAGGGGGGAGAGTTLYGGGGGEGARVQDVLLTVVPATVYSIGIGAGGAAGAYYAGAYDASQLGGDGGDTTFGALLTVPGGKGGGDAAASDCGQGGLGGTVTIGGVEHFGEPGESNSSGAGYGSYLDGNGGGRGRGWRRRYGTAASAGKNGGGGCGGVASGAANLATDGGDGYIRFMYLQVDLNGLPTAV